METIKSLEKTSFDHLFEAFKEAFGSYEVQLNKDELHAMLCRRGFDPQLSFGLFVNDRLVSFTLNGIGNFNGSKTAYDTGTGTIKEYRGKGMASRIFSFSIPFLQEAGISQYLLEVLQQNTSAISVYKNLGFTVSREFNYFVQSNDRIRLSGKDLSEAFQIKRSNLENKEFFVKFQDFCPSWQNSFDAIQRCLEKFIVLGAYEKQNLVGYCIFEPESGDITQIAVDKDYRRRGIATALLKKALCNNRHSSVKAINTEIYCESLTAFLESNGIPLKGKQYEMVKRL